MRNALRTAIPPLLFTMMFLSSAQAQYGGYGQGYGRGGMPSPMDREEEEQGRLPMKKPGFLKRPDRKTPAEQLEYAKWLSEQKWGHKAAARAYRDLVHTWHESPEAVTAQLAYAGLLEERAKYRAAFEEYQYLIEYFGGRFNYDDVIDRQFRIASHVMSQRRGRFLWFPGFDLSEHALQMFMRIAENAPKSQKAPVARFLVGLIHEDHGEYAEAVRAYETIPYDYPESEHAADAAFRRADCLKILADKHPRDESSIRAAVTALAGFLRDHAKDQRRAEAEKNRDGLLTRLEDIYYQRAVFYDRNVKRPRAALIAYDTFTRECPWSDRIERVAKRMEELREIVEAEDNESDE